MKTAVVDQYAAVLSAIEAFHPKSYMDIVKSAADQGVAKFCNSEHAFTPMPISVVVDDLLSEGLVARDFDSYVVTSTGKLFLIAEGDDGEVGSTIHVGLIPK